MPEDFGAEVGAAERMVRQWQERATEKAERFGRMQAEIEAISVTEASEDGAVRVTVGSDGTLRDLNLAEHAANRSMSKLSTEIMRVLRCARSRLPELMRQAAAETVGTEDPAVQHVLSKARESFPEPPAEDAPEGPPTPGPGVREMRLGPEDEDGAEPTPERSARSRPQPEEPDDDDDDFENRSFLR
ncbi:YbaB/EbfC family nucleoid-associated protein [Actinopolyspora mortivallis]|uniref:YbaB/EbfC family nucleoid-associated protein n=1 Tax=Actinopolyspora mortivallis TaxID=33906 RepID=UPI0003782461|nr:YbaB/EbfC family nucleoid-associated protein [Actinopolyspora mortivallis]